MKEKILYIAKTHSRGKEIQFGIKPKDRTRHMYIIGQTGTGKSTLLSNLIVQDIQSGEGLALIDPHGELAENIMHYIPEHRVQEVVHFSPFDTEYPIAFNLFDEVSNDEKPIVAQGLLSTFVRVWGEESFSDRMQYITMNVILALLEYPGATMLGMTRILTDKTFRNDVLSYVTDSAVLNFWQNEFGTWDDRYRKDATAPLMNKFGQFISNPIVKNVIGQTHTKFDFSAVMNRRKILIINLSKGRIGEQNADLLGSMLVTKIYLTIMRRAEAGEADRGNLPPFYLYVDEFQNFASESFSHILAEARKYKLGLIMAHQYIEQMPEAVRAAVFGNVGTMIAFRIGATDAEIFEKEFAPLLLQSDFVNMEFGQIYLRLTIDGIPSRPFLASTMPPRELPELSYRDATIRYSRETYGTLRAVVERQIDNWYRTASQGDTKENQTGQNSERKNLKVRSFTPQRTKSSGGENSPSFKNRKKENPEKNRNSLRDALQKARNGQQDPKPDHETSVSANSTDLLAQILER